MANKHLSGKIMSTDEFIAHYNQLADEIVEAIRDLQDTIIVNVRYDIDEDQDEGDDE